MSSKAFEAQQILTVIYEVSMDAELLTLWFTSCKLFKSHHCGCHAKLESL